MLASVDHFLSRRRRDDYDCRDLVREAWLAHTGEDIGERRLKIFRRLEKPVDPCIVRFRRNNENHMGMFIRGKVLHLSEHIARFDRLDLIIGFEHVRFYQ